MQYCMLKANMANNIQWVSDVIGHWPPKSYCQGGIGPLLYPIMWMLNILGWEYWEDR